MTSIDRNGIRTMMPPPPLRCDLLKHVVHVGESPLVYHPERHAYLAEYEEHEKEAQQLLQRLA